LDKTSHQPFDTIGWLTERASSL